jgi:hypothetical protein
VRKSGGRLLWPNMRVISWRLSTAQAFSAALRFVVPEGLVAAVFLSSGKVF